MKIIVTLELANPQNCNLEEIEKDIRMSESQIGWDNDYKVISVTTT